MDSGVRRRRERSWTSRAGVFFADPIIGQDLGDQPGFDRESFGVEGPRKGVHILVGREAELNDSFL